jgi:transposase
VLRAIMPFHLKTGIETGVYRGDFSYFMTSVLQRVNPEFTLTLVGLRYTSDTTDPEWKLIEPLMPVACRRGRPREIDLRMIMDAILYIAGTGCQWRALPKDFPPCSTVRYYFYKWRGFGLWRTINGVLVQAMGRRKDASLRHRPGLSTAKV